jgi:hypothetical protein
MRVKDNRKGSFRRLGQALSATQHLAVHQLKVVARPKTTKATMS